MNFRTKDIALPFAIAVLLTLITACGSQTATEPTVSAEAMPQPEPTAAFEPPPAPSPQMPDLQAELLDGRSKSSHSPLVTVDFKNFTYPLPRGWHHPDGDEITLENGRQQPKIRDIQEDMSPEDKAAARAERRIGMSYVTTKYFDIDADGLDEAAVILKIETGGTAIPQLVYLYTWKDDKPELIWNFRTGDRADGGLKDIRIENGEAVVELYGQDRFILGQTETGKITGDEQQLCCPTSFTRSFYKWNGRSFTLSGKRLTYEVANPSTAPLENFGDIMNDPVKGKKFLDRLKSSASSPKSK